MTKSHVAITDLLDDNDTKVELTTLQWPDMKYPSTPDIVFLPQVHGIPPSYSAHDNHKVANDLPIDVPGSTATWKYHDTIREVVDFAHRIGKGASLQHSDLHPVLNASNWSADGPGHDCIPNDPLHLVDTIYSEFTILDPQSSLVQAATPLMVESVLYPIAAEAALYADPPTNNNIGSGGSQIGSNDSFAKAISNGIAAVLDNTSEGSKRSQRKKTLQRSCHQYQLLGAHKETGTSGGLIALPGELSDAFIEFLATTDVTSNVQLAKDGLSDARDAMKADRDPVAYFIDFRPELMTPAFAKCLQNCIYHAEPLHLNIPILDKKICSLQCLPVDRNNISYNEMITSYRTRALEDLHDERDELRSAKTTNLFIDGECSKATHVFNCIANQMMFLVWFYKNPTETCWYSKLLAVFTLLESRAGAEWLDHIVIEEPHIHFSLYIDL